jgi:hypothetical protein
MILANSSASNLIVIEPAPFFGLRFRHAFEIPTARFSDGVCFFPNFQPRFAMGFLTLGFDERIYGSYLVD